MIFINERFVIVNIPIFQEIKFYEFMNVKSNLLLSLNFLNSTFLIKTG